MSKRHASAPRCAIECSGADLLVTMDGRTIAKRGRPNTPQAGTWVPQEPGVAVYGDDGTLLVEINGVKVH